MPVGKDINEQELQECAEGQQSNDTVSPAKPAGTRMGTFLNWRSGDDEAPLDSPRPNRLRDGSK